MGRVLLTGATGLLGTRLRAWFAEHGRAYVGTDIRPLEQADAAPFLLVDLTDPKAVDALMIGIDTVVHFGGASREVSWDALFSGNIIGCYNVFDAARRAGIKRIIYASSYHVVGLYPVGTPVDVSSSPRPSSLYGVTKIFGETLARYYFDKFGIECLCIRIAAATHPLPDTTRASRIWFSPGDLARLVDAAIDAPVLGFKTVFGVSDNPQGWYRNAFDPDLNWVSQDSSGNLGLDFVDAPLDPADPENQFQGGVWAQWGHFDDTKTDEI